MTATEKAWLAGLVDGEGNLFTAIYPRKDRSGLPPQLTAKVAIGMTHLPTLKRVKRIVGKGCLSRWPRGTARHVMWAWTAYNCTAAALLRELLPYLVTKRKQAELFLQVAAPFPQRTVDWPRRAKLIQKMKRALTEGMHVG